MKKRYITYKIEIGCEVTETGAVIPRSCNNSIKEDGRPTRLNLTDYPCVHKIMTIWNGVYYSYPNLNDKDLNQLT